MNTFHIENWRLCGEPGHHYIVGDLNPGHITTSRVVTYNPLQGWADTLNGRVTLGKQATPSENASE